MKCVFCKTEIPKGEGVIYVKRSGVAVSFCSSKCRKNKLVLDRNPRKLKWVGKEL